MLNALKQLFIAFLISLILCPPSLVYADGIHVDPGAPAQNQATVDAAQNGVPVVNIAKPNGSGLSHNKFLQFNVGTEGVILNNSTIPGISQLGGVLAPNANLNGTAASTILNEVTGTGRSSILGHTEIFGQSANYILANPNGISINGGGFINTPRATMATGAPQFSGSDLLGIDVTGGDILIHGAGVNASNIDAFELVTRVASINADIYAKDLNVVTGQNRFDPATGTVTPLASDGTPSPTVSIDSSALGGMYAGRIKLVGTEAGVGVNTQGLIQSTEHLEMTADGRIQIKGTASSGQSLAITSVSDAVEVSGTVKAVDTATVTGQTVSVAKVDAADKAIIVADKVRINGGTLDNDHVVAAESDLAVATDNVHNTGTLYSGDTALFRIADTLHNDHGTILAKNDAVFEGAADGLMMAALTNDSGVIESLDGGLIFRATDFHNNNSEFTLVEGATQLGVEEGAFWHNGKHMGHLDSLFQHYIGTPPSPMERLLGSIELTLLSYTDLDPTKNIYTKEEVVAEFAKLDAKIAADPSSVPVSIQNALAWQRQFIELDVKYVAKAVGRNDGIVARLVHSRDTATGQELGSQIAAQGDILIESDTAKNTVSKITSATGNIEINATSFENVGKEIYDRTMVQIGRGIFHSGSWGAVGYAEDVMLTPIDYAYGTLDAGNKVIISSGAVANGVIERNGIHLPPDPATQQQKVDNVTDLTAAIPANGLFQENTNPAQNYVIETNPLFTDLSAYYGTEYLAALVGFDPNAAANKRLGDAYYETKLVRRQIMELTGKRYLDFAIGTDTDQFKTLMDNAAAAHSALNLEVGVSLTADQVAALTDDIVWMERQVVNGQEVLVPVVYLCSASLEKIAQGGSVIVAADVEVNATGDVTNTGLIEADNQLVITADNFFNTKGTVAGQTVVADASDSIRNTGGTIQGGTVTLKAANDVVSSGDTLVGVGVDTVFTQIGRRGEIKSDGDLTIEAGGDIGIIGSDVEAGGDALLGAGGNVAIASQETVQNTQGGGRGSSTTVDAAFQSRSKVKIGGDLIIDAGETASVHGSQVEAGGDVTIAAGDDVSITSARNAYTFHAQSSGAKDRTVDQTGQKSIASTVAAGGSVTIASGVQHGETGDPATGSVNIHGSTVKAARDVTITSAENLNITAAQDENSYRDHAIGEGMMGTGSMELDEKRSVTTTRTRIEAGDKVALTATDDVTIQAASIASGDTTDITAEEGRVAMLVTKDVEYEHYSKTKNGMFKWSFKDKGKTDETVQHTEIEAGGGLTITTAEGVVVEYRETGNVQEDIAQLAQAPGLAWMGELAKRDDIDWQAVQEVHNQWNKSDSGIGGPGMQLVSLAMALALSLTPGGQGFATGVLGLAEEGVMTAAVAAGFNALVIQAGMQVVGNGGDIGAALEALASIDTVRILATAMLTAGLMQGLENADFMKEFVGTGAAEGAEGMDKFIAHLAQKLKQNAIQAGVNTGVGTAIYGGDLGENLIANMRGAAVSAFGEVTANEIGQAYAKGDFNYVTHKVAHAALGGALAVANGEDVTSGALGGVVGEVTYEFVKDWTFDQLAELKNQKQITPQQLKEKTDELKKFAVAGVDIAKLSAGVAAAAVGGDIYRSRCGW